MSGQLVPSLVGLGPIVEQKNPPFPRDQVWVNPIKCGSRSFTTQHRERAPKIGLEKQRKLIGYPGPGRGV